MSDMPVKAGWLADIMTYLKYVNAWDGGDYETEHESSHWRML